MSFYNVCEKCGANLDPGETCDCRQEAEKQTEFYLQHLKTEPKSGQIGFVLAGMGAGYEQKSYC